MVTESQLGRYAAQSTVRKWKISRFDLNLAANASEVITCFCILEVGESGGIGDF